MLAGVTGVVVLVAGILLVLLIAGVALLLHVRQRRSPTQEASREATRTSWPRPAAQQQDPAQPSWWQEDTPRPDAPRQDTGGATTRLPLVRGPVKRSPIDSARAQRDPETVITRRDPEDGSLFRPPDPPPR